MTRKADFNAEVWTTIVNAPLYAGVRVMSAARGGTFRESMAMNTVYGEARAQHGASTLLDAIVASPPTIDARLVQSSGDIAAVADQQLRAAVSALETKATAEELDSYKTFVMTVAQAVAAAHREGGFLGIGGTAISDAENDALDEISHALGPPPDGAIVSEP